MGRESAVQADELSSAGETKERTYEKWRDIVETLNSCFKSYKRPSMPATTWLSDGKMKT